MYHILFISISFCIRHEKKNTRDRRFFISVRYAYVIIEVQGGSYMILPIFKIIILICFPFFMYSVTKRLKEIRDLLQQLNQDKGEPEAQE